MLESIVCASYIPSKFDTKIELVLTHLVIDGQGRLSVNTTGALI